MADLASPDAAKRPARARKPRTKKYIIARPGTAEEISRGVGVTKKDAALVRKVLLELGYIREDVPAKHAGVSRAKKERSTARKS